MKKFAYLLFCIVALSFAPAALAQVEFTGDSTSDEWFDRPETTYEKFLPLAVKGDAEIQNFLGYMYFYGEGVMQNYKEAYAWFLSAAEQNNLKAQRNLAIFHSGAINNLPQEYINQEETEKWLKRAEENYTRKQQLGKLRTENQSNRSEAINATINSGEVAIGEKIYSTFCSGCHGLNGVAAYPGAPSFSSGERLFKDDPVLLGSIINGKGNMPAWGGTLDAYLIEYALAYIRARFGNTLKNNSSQAEDEFETPEFGDTVHGGELLFVKFCAGCHGFNGIAYYVNSPSFALGERLHKNDLELQRSITNGKNAMPSWGDKLSREEIRNIVLFIRTLHSSFQQGIAGSLRNRPETYFRFRPLGETGTEWIGSDAIGVPLPD